MNHYGVSCTDGGWVDLYVLEDCCKLKCLAEYGEAYLDKEQCKELAHKLMLVAERLQESVCGGC